ncbi:MAG: TIGR00730 family Rossman fold protein, partial [Cyanobacteria bacterium]|nr:TIGR00730 family Rossman fold protein [Cyanobacteriota bacterium]
PRGFFGSAVDSALYAGIQSPVNGVVQLADKVADTNMLPSVQMMEAPTPAAMGTAEWYGQSIGTVVGGAAPYVAMYRLAGPGAGARLELSAGYGLNRAALPVIGRSALAGAAYSGIFQPVPEGQDFYTGRLINMGVGAATTVALTSATIGLKGTRIPLLQNDIVAGGLSGLPAGAMGVNLHSVLEGRGLASVNQTVEGAATFALGGAFMGAANTVHEIVRPTSGMRGVRTWQQMSDLADSTRAPGWQNFGNRARSADIQSPQTGTIYQETVRMLQASSHNFTPDQISRLARVQQDLAFSMRELEPLRPTVTIYGSARTPETSFAYQRTRYMAGALARDGWTVMTGGGLKGIMRAGNQGAFEAGGRSVGVNIELPMEQRPNPFQTTSITHEIFSSRKEALRLTDAAIFEVGGFGTLDEAMELLTLVQTGKQNRIPMFFMCRENYGGLQRFFQQMLAQGTISPHDMHLFPIIEDPSQVVRQLSAYRAAHLDPLARPQPAPSTQLRAAGAQ